MFTWFHFYAWALPILFIKSVSVSHSPALIYPMCMSCTQLCVCVCLCAKFVCQRNHNFWVFKSRNATPHTTVSHSQLEAARRQLGRGSAKFVFHASLPSVLKVKCKISKPVPAAQIIPFISAHKNVIQLSDVDSSVYHPSVTCSKVKLIEPIIKCCNNYTISWQIQN